MCWNSARSAAPLAFLWVSSCRNSRTDCSTPAYQNIQRQHIPRDDYLADV